MQQNQNSTMNSPDWEEQLRRLKEQQEAAGGWSKPDYWPTPQPCPNCGRCLTCGRGARYTITYGYPGYTYTSY